MNRDGVEGTSNCNLPDSAVPRSQCRQPWPLGFTDLNGDEGRIEADLTVTHTGEDRITRSVEACLAELEPGWEATELGSSTLMLRLIGMRGIVDIWRPDDTSTE